MRGGGVEVEETIAGDLLTGAVDGVGGCLSKVLTAPLFGSLITIPLLCRPGILKVVDLAGAGLAIGGWTAWWLDAGVRGVCG